MIINRIKQIFDHLNNRETIILLLILTLAIILNLYHHLHYPYPFHVDEWYHIARAKQITYGSEFNWYSGTNFTIDIEMAWHIMLSLIYSVFKLSIKNFIILPTVFFVFSIIIVYIFVLKLYGKKEALISSLLIAILPTNVTMGGPVFLIPINLSLIFIPLALIFAFKLINIRDVYYYVFLFLILTFLLFAHPPTAVVLLFLLGFYFLLNLFSKNIQEKKHAFYLFITISLSLLATIVNYILYINQEGSLTFNFWIKLQGIPFIYGFIPTIFFIFGFYFLTKKDNKESWSIILTTIVLLINILIFTFTGTNYILPYIRTHIPLFLLMSIIASYGYIKIFNFMRFQKKIKAVFILAILIATAAISIQSNINSNYYQLIDDQDYDSFLWIKENTETDIIVLSDPWKARALAPVAERTVYTVLPFGPVEEKMKLVFKANDFFAENCSNTSFLIKNDIDIVYTRGICNNSLLIEVYDNTYRFIRQ